MGQRVMRAAVCVTFAVLVGGTGGTAALGAQLDAVMPAPAASPTGTYIVLLDEEPAATYAGGKRGLPATAADEGEKLDTHSPGVKKYAAFLEERQHEIAEQAGVEPISTYQMVLNGFAAQLTTDAAAQLAAIDGVAAVYPDQILRPDGMPSGRAAGAAATTTLGTAVLSEGGAGVVIGLIDTGIAPDNPSFAGDRLASVKGADPYLVGNTVVIDKADGRQFRSTRFTDQDWTRSDYSTKLVGAQFFASSATAAGFDFGHDVLSPRDLDGHGSRVAGIAAGNAVDVEIDGAEFDTVAGAGPDAKVASYKACFVGQDPQSTLDDVCVGSDVLAALDRAVADGVDIVSYSLSGPPEDRGWSADDIAFHNAAAAGVFIAVSAGNAGPGAATAQGGAPWYTTVAASTSPAFEATVRLSDGFEAPGVSASVRDGDAISAPVVYAGDAALDGSADAHLCYLGTLDPAVVDGRIVVCDRGTNPRSEKAREVADAGGVGMILVNVTPDSVDADLDAVPTVHIDAAQRDALLAGAESGATATLVAGNLTDVSIPSPQIAPFSGRGPVGAGDVLTPDVAAPGVDILSATRDTPAGDAAWDIASGTSMAAPHVAGLAARYLGARPDATPDEIKSALMTTASDTVNADGSAGVDPFAQGAGQVDGERLLDPGLLYLNGQTQWVGYLREHGHAEMDVLDPSGDVNLASISIPQLGVKQTATRTLTATRAGTYDVTASIPGVDVTVSPASLTFAGPGDSQRFTVAFTNDSAPAEVWATGFLTWTGEDGTTVRSPLAVRPVTASGTALVAGEGIDGTANAQFVSGTTGELTLDASGMAPVELLIDPDDPVPGHSGDAASGDENGRIAWVVPIPAGSPIAEFALVASNDSDLDLAVYRLTGADEQTFDESWRSTTAGEERVTLIDPSQGRYLVVADLSEAAEGTTFDLTSAVVSGADRSLTVVPQSVSAVAGEDEPFTLSWSGLRHDTDYLGVIRYGDSDARTMVRVAAGPPAPVADEPPVVSGGGQLGEQLSVDPGTWAPDDVTFTYQWLRDGEPVEGATRSEYRVRVTDAGSELTAQVTARQRDNLNAGTALSEPVVVKSASRVEVTMNRSVGTDADAYAVTVAVETMRGEPASGSVTVSVDATPYVGTLAEGRVTFALPAQDPGIHVVVVDYSGSEGVGDSTGISGFVVRDAANG